MASTTLAAFILLLLAACSNTRVLIQQPHEVSAGAEVESSGKLPNIIIEFSEDYDGRTSSNVILEKVHWPTAASETSTSKFEEEKPSAHLMLSFRDDRDFGDDATSNDSSQLPARSIQFYSPKDNTSITVSSEQPIFQNYSSTIPDMLVLQVVTRPLSSSKLAVNSSSATVNKNISAQQQSFYLAIDLASSSSEDHKHLDRYLVNVNQISSSTASADDQGSSNNYVVKVIKDSPDDCDSTPDDCANHLPGRDKRQAALTAIYATQASLIIFVSAIVSLLMYF